MIRLYVLAAIATLAIPILMPQQFAPASFPSEWVSGLMLTEILCSALFLKLMYSRNHFIRCMLYGLIFILVRMLFCLGASLIDPDARVLWAGIGYNWTEALVPSVNYMYSIWGAALAQYLVLLLWLPSVFEMLLPGIFPPRVLPHLRKPVAEQFDYRIRRSRLAEQPMSFPEIEEELASYPGLIGWAVFSSEKLPVWQAGERIDNFEQAPDILRRMSDLCAPLLRPEWGRTVNQSMVQTDHGYCVLTTLPGGFLFGSLWRVEGDDVPGRKILTEVIERMETWLHYRFLEIE